MAKTADSTKVPAKTKTKIIKCVRSEKTGSYTFKEEIIPSEQVKDYLSMK